MANLQIKDLPDEVHDELRRRARLEGLTMRDYVVRLLRADQVTPSREQWLARLRARPRITPDAPVAELLAADRRGRDDDVAT